MVTLDLSPCLSFSDTTASQFWVHGALLQVKSHWLQKSYFWFTLMHQKWSIVSICYWIYGLWYIYHIEINSGVLEALCWAISAKLSAPCHAVSALSFSQWQKRLAMLPLKRTKGALSHIWCALWQGIVWVRWHPHWPILQKNLIIWCIPVVSCQPSYPLNSKIWCFSMSASASIRTGWYEIEGYGWCYALWEWNCQSLM